MPTNVKDQWGNAIDPATMQEVKWNGVVVGYMFKNPLTGQMNYAQSNSGSVGTGSNGKLDFVRPNASTAVTKSTQYGPIQQALQIDGVTAPVFQNDPNNDPTTQIYQKKKAGTGFSDPAVQTLAALAGVAAGGAIAGGAIAGGGGGAGAAGGGIGATGSGGAGGIALSPAAKAAAAGVTAGTAGTGAGVGAGVGAGAGAGGGFGGMLIGAIPQIATAVLSSALSDDFGAEESNQAARDNLNAKTAIEKSQYAFWQQYYQPVEINLTKEALAAGSTQRQDEAAAEVGSSLAQSYDAGDAELKRALEASGGNPADPAYTSALASQKLARAAQTGGAQYQARKGIRDEAFNKQLAVSQTGRNIPAVAAQGLGTSANQYALQGAQANNLQRQQQSDIAYVLNPIANGIGNQVRSWWSTPNATSTVNPSTGNSWATDLERGVIPMAAGGIVEKPTKALIGEEGDEAVLNAGALKLIGKKDVARLNRLGNLLRNGVPREALERKRVVTSIRGVA